MSQWPEDYVKYVLDDVAVYPKNNKPVKASLYERLTVKNLAPIKCHANPIDEFSWDSVGPNFGIVGNYADEMRRNMSLDQPLFSEPIIVEKMSPEGYMIINGHHRWFASLRAQAPKIWVNIVNLTHAEDVKSALQKTDNNKSVAFDLDEVLLADENEYTVEQPKKLIGRKAIKERLRLGAVQLINGFREKKYDIWVYTSSYKSEKYIRSIFELYGLEVEGIINGAGRKKDESSEDISKMINDKYRCRIHVDNESVLYAHPETKTFDQFDLTGDNDKWAEEVLDIIDNKIKE